MKELEAHYLFANDANIGQATRSPTMKAEDKTPSSKLLRLKSPLWKQMNQNYSECIFFLQNSSYACYISSTVSSRLGKNKYVVFKQ